MRRPWALWVSPVVAFAVAACAQSPPRSSAPSPSSSAAASSAAQAAGINPANIKRVAREFPDGYEVTRSIPNDASPRLIWGLGADAADPPQCAALADPGNGREQSAQGVSGSGAGGILNAVVVSLPSGQVSLDTDVVAACGRWTGSDGRKTVSVSLLDAPPVDGAPTVGMVADVKTSVESGTQIDARTYTFIAYLGNHYAFTTLTTDPGSMLPPLPPQFVADLLVKTVATLRG
ncbi:DUF5642 family protein [Mycobacterium bourgelatii]|uniref:DUF5642 domain-containing protein n=1 Tax=Mycobacterium bourgelatii TaxID=1273442 RepID=A0A7I9YVG2_MYCBU|nr:DUF5642 family protein [Mycobacterium bourgelatii]MCV6976178.1 DUF5642 family protein [Mycobacterium bourgelatii]GFG92566.1 hypothetical protein MBOU_46080 [Mycobacterium bourgelatii]